MPTVTVKLSKPEFSKLEAMAAALRRTKSDVLRQALAKSARTSASLLDAMRPYSGKLRGPGDLSTNKSRMKGYGASRSR
jgi:Ribbon-helix-helix protein, copG family